MKRLPLDIVLRDRPGVRPALLVLSGALAVFAAGGAALRVWPAQAYNVRELIQTGRPALASAALGLCLLVTGAAPLLLARLWAGRPGRFAWAGPCYIVAASVLVYALVWWALPHEILGDLLGAPVLALTAGLENLGRFVGLYLGILAGLTIGARLTVGGRPAREELSGLLGLAALWGVSYAVVVRYACTEKIVELLRDEGGWASAVAVFDLMVLLGLAAGAVAGAVERAFEGRWVPSAGAAVVVLASVPLGWLLLVTATNPALTRYGRTFAARQFLLSPDREHSLGDGALLPRFAAAGLAATAALSVGMLIGRLLVRESADRGRVARRLSSVSEGGILPPPRRVHYAALTAAFAALAVYGSLVPLQFQPVPLSEAWERFRQIPFLTLGIESRSDWVANILLFVPLGFLSTAALRVDRPGSLRALASAAAVVAACACLSIAIEFSQIWFPPRTVSQNDIAAECLGAVAGVGLWCLAGQSLTGLFRDYARTLSPRHKLDLILHFYLLGLLIYSVLPLDLTISPAHLWRKYREGRILILGVESGDPVMSAYTILSKVVTFVPVGLLIGFRFPPSRGRLRDISRGLSVGALLAAVIETAQLLVFSRVTNGADVVCGALGAALGVGLLKSRDTFGAVGGTPGRHERPWVWLVLAAGYTFILAGFFWFPFAFTTDRAQTRVSTLVRVPFAAMYWGTDWNAMTQITRKVLWFLPLGALTALAVAPGGGGRSGRRLRISAGLVACLVVAMAIELGQAFLPDRVADVTDVLLYETGAAVGLLTAARLLELGASGGWAKTSSSQEG